MVMIPKSLDAAIANDAEYRARQASSADHTPTPWFADKGVLWVEGIQDDRHLECCGNFDQRGNCCDNPITTGDISPTQEQIGQASEDDAEFIVKAVNSYDSSRALIAELVAALEALRACFNDDGELFEWHEDQLSAAWQKGDAALAKAKAQP